MQATSEDIVAVGSMVLELCGIVLDETKGYLVEGRLSELAAKQGCKTFTELAWQVRKTNDAALKSQVINAITTNETLFFRDNSPFDALQHKALPELIDTKARTPFPQRLRLWSAACSTGQEPYSIAMTLRQLIPDIDRWDVTIYATDISDAALQRASRGLFSDHEIRRGMKPELLSRYFRQLPDTQWKICDEVRAMVSFERRNLLHPFTSIGPYDVIFCRNVAIYFSPEDRRKLFQNLAKLLTPNGYLFAGSAESLADLGQQFTPQHHCRSVFYQPTRMLAAK
jgi:chemotaxis protein methyltransferase CheR